MTNKEIVSITKEVQEEISKLLIKLEPLELKNPNGEYDEETDETDYPSDKERDLYLMRHILKQLVSKNNNELTEFYSSYCYFE